MATLPTLGATSYEQQIRQYNQLSAKFRKACSQVVLLNNLIIDYQSRYDQAVNKGQRSFRYVLRLRLMSVEGVRNSFYEYARQTGVKIERMQQQLIRAGLMEEEYTDDDDEDMEIY